MSDEGMSDAHLKALAGLYKDADDSGMESKWEAIGNALCNAYPLIIARLDAAERERDALREAFARVYDGDATLVRDAFDGAANTPTKAAAYRVAGAVATARAALTANHSAPVVEE